jgi:hypothetical protein
MKIHVRQREIAAALQCLIIIIMPNNHRLNGADDIRNAFRRVSPRLIQRFLCLAILTAIFLTTAAAGTDTNSPSPSLAARVEKACAKKKIDDKLGALAKLGETLSVSEIPEAIKAAEKLKQLRERVVLTECVLKRWGELAPAEAFAWISDMPEGMTKVESLRSVVPSYASKDIHAAAADAVKMKPGRARNETVQMLAELWAKTNAKSAINWVNSLPEGFPKDAALRDIYFVWVHLDPAGISSMVQKLPPGDTKNALIINVAGDWAALDASNAVKWAEALPVEADKKLALATVAESWADVDPLAAAEFALKLSPPELQARAVMVVLERWATQDPQQALSWLAKAPEYLQAGGVARVLNVFAPVSPEAAAKWVDQLPAGPVRESAIGNYVEAVRQYDPGAGARLALKTADAAERERRVEQCFVVWLAWDPDSAKQWLKGADFSEALKNHWLSEKPSPGF